MFTSVKQTLKSLVTWQDVQPAKFTVPDCRCLDGDTAECRKRLEDAVMTDASTVTRRKETRVRQTERIIIDLVDSGTTNSSSSGSGQHKRVRFSG